MQQLDSVVPISDSKVLIQGVGVEAKTLAIAVFGRGHDLTICGSPYHPDAPPLVLEINMGKTLKHHEN